MLTVLLLECWQPVLLRTMLLCGVCGLSSWDLFSAVPSSVYFTGLYLKYWSPWGKVSQLSIYIYIVCVCVILDPKKFWRMLLLFTELSELCEKIDHLCIYNGASLVAQHKESTCQCRRLGSIPGSGKSPGEGNGHPLQYSCLRNPIDREALGATVHGSQRVGHKLATK